MERRAGQINGSSDRAQYVSTRSKIVVAEGYCIRMGFQGEAQDKVYVRNV